LILIIDNVWSIITKPSKATLPHIPDTNKIANLPSLALNCSLWKIRPMLLT